VFLTSSLSPLAKGVLSANAVLGRATWLCSTAQFFMQTLTSTGTRLWSFLVVFFPLDCNGYSHNLIFQPTVEVSYRNFMWPWFLGLVYESVITEKPRNEDK